MPDPPEGRYVASPHDQVADEEIVIHHIRQRENYAVKDRLTLRMEARRLIDALDAGRAMRAPRGRA